MRVSIYIFIYIVIHTIYIVFYIYHSGRKPANNKERERRKMLNMNLESNIDNLLFLEYMQKQQEEFNAEKKEHLEKESTRKD